GPGRTGAAPPGPATAAVAEPEAETAAEPERAVIGTERDREDADAGVARLRRPLQRRQEAARLGAVRQQHDRAGNLPVATARRIADRRLHRLHGELQPVADR